MSNATLVDKSAIEDAIKALRSDISPENFLVIGYEDPKTIKLMQVGSKGLSGAKEYFKEGTCCYALLRIDFMHIEPGKELKTVKFVFVYFRSESISVKYKMKVGLYENQIRELMSPYHTDILISENEEIDDNIITRLLQKVSGTATYNINQGKKSTGYFLGGKAVNSTADMANNRVKKTEVTESTTTKTSSSSSAGAPVTFSEGEPLNTIGDVRNDSTETNWCIFGYATVSDKKNLIPKGSGKGGLGEMKANFEADNINYGLIRITEMIDSYETVKFCFIVSIPDGLNPMKRGITTTHKGFVANSFSPYHGDLTIASPDEMDSNDVLKACSSLLKSNVISRA